MIHKVRLLQLFRSAHVDVVLRGFFTTPPRCCAASRWVCGCGFGNYSFRHSCFRCHKENPQSLNDGDPLSASQECRREHAYEVPSSPGYSQTSSQQQLLKGDWLCSCGTHNFAKRERCMTCNTPRHRVRGRGEVVAGARLLQGDWICASCNAHNFRARSACFQCKQARPCSPADTTTTVSRSPQQSSWVCASCHSANSTDEDSCVICGQKKLSLASSDATGAQMSYSNSVRPGDWQCPQCSYMNFGSRSKCKRCDTENSHGGNCNGVSEGATMLECKCGYRNFLSRSTCRECGSLLTETRTVVGK